MKTESFEKLRHIKYVLRLISKKMRKSLPELGELLDECADDIFDIELAEAANIIIEVKEETKITQLFGVTDD